MHVMRKVQQTQFNHLCQLEHEVFESVEFMARQARAADAVGAQLLLQEWVAYQVRHAADMFCLLSLKQFPCSKVSAKKPMTMDLPKATRQS